MDAIDYYCLYHIRNEVLPNYHHPPNVTHKAHSALPPPFRVCCAVTEYKRRKCWSRRVARKQTNYTLNIGLMRRGAAGRQREEALRWR